MIKTLFSVELYCAGVGSQVLQKLVLMPYPLRTGDAAHITLGEEGEYYLTVSETSFDITNMALYVGLGAIEENLPENHESGVLSLIKAGWDKV